MEIPPDIAAKVLSDDLNNIIAKVAAGGVLSGLERELMRQFALTRDTASQARVGSLLAKWRAGARLTQPEIDEIRLHDFTFAPEAAPSLPGSPACQTTPESLPLASEDSPGEHGFVLGEDPRAPRVSLTGEQLARWGALYGTQRRQLRRWHNAGIEHSDPCPFDHPAQMPSWWGRRMTQRCPDKILLAAAAAAPPPSSDGNDGPPSAEKPKSEEAAPGPSVKPFAFNDTGVVEGELVKQARIVVATSFRQMEIAAAAGDSAEHQRWMRNWKESGETLRKHERDDREWQEQSKLLLPRGRLLSELAQFFEALRLMRSSMPDKVVAALDKRADRRLRRVLKVLGPSIKQAVIEVRDREGDLLQSIDSLNSGEEAAAMLTLAA